MRYVTRPQAVWSEYSDMGVSLTADQIITSDEIHQPSGLLNANGEMLYRQRERVEFGFRGRHEA